jgi:hypothetical protein
MTNTDKARIYKELDEWLAIHDPGITIETGDLAELVVGIVYDSAERAALDASPRLIS